MRKNIVLFSLFLALMLVAVTWPAMAQEENAQPSWQTVYFQDTGEILMNKEMGWVLLEEPLYAGRASLGWEGDFPEVSSVSMSMNWANIEVADGVYDWSYLDQAINYWTALGKRINFRIAGDRNCIGYPLTSAPDWLGDECGVPYIFMPEHYGRSYYFADPVFLEKHDRFVWALADRYRDHPMIDVIEIRTYGIFGEWHSGGNFASVDERVNTLRHIIDIWCEAWGEDKLMVVSASYEFDQSVMPYTVLHEGMQRMSDFAYVSAFDYAVQKGVAFRRDGIGGAILKWDGKMLNDTFTLNNRLPNLGEHFGGYATFQKEENGYDLWEMMYEALYHLHVNYMTAIGWVAEPFAEVTVPKEEGGSPEIVDFGNRYMGYRLMPHAVQYPTSLAPGEPIAIRSIWANLGSGRAWNTSYLTWYLTNVAGEVAWQFTDTSFDPVIMNAGDIHFIASDAVIPKTLPAGEYTLSLALTNPETGEAELKLPIASRDAMGCYPVGTLQISGSQPKQSPLDLLAGTEIASFSENEKSTGVILESPLPTGTYLITLDYQSLCQQENIEITSTERYILSLMKDGKAVQQYLWRDVSSQASSRTLLVSAQEEGEYTIQLRMKKSYPLIVHSLTALPLSAAVLTEDFEGTGDHFIIATQDAKYALDKQYAIGGKMGIRIRNLINDQRAEGAYSKALEPNTAYLISFGTQGYGGDMPGAHYYMDLVCPDDPEKTVQIAAWYDRNDFGPVNHTYFFITPDAEKCYLSFGAYQKASFTMDNVVLAALESSVSPITGQMPEIERNVSRAPEFESYPIEIDFEGGSIHSILLTPGPDHMGRLTDREGEVITGNYSGYGFVAPGSDKVTNCFMKSTTHEIPLLAGSTYLISFDYRIIQAPAEGDALLFEIQPTDGSPTITRHLSGETGSIQSFQWEYAAQAENALLYWIVQGSGAVAIDNIRIIQERNEIAIFP